MVELRYLGDVVLDDPLPVVHLGLVGEHHPQRRDPAQLCVARPTVHPVVDRQHGHHGIECVVSERQPLRHRANGRTHLERSLAHHRHRGIDRHDRPVDRLVRAGSRADVEYALRPAQGLDNPRCDTRVGVPLVGIADADGVVGWALRRSRLGSVGHRQSSSPPSTWAVPDVTRSCYRSAIANPGGAHR